jgi:hypothetical protein
VLDAVAAYNELIDYLPTLPQEIRDTGESPKILHIHDKINKTSRSIQLCSGVSKSEMKR